MDILKPSTTRYVMFPSSVSWRRLGIVWWQAN